MADAGFFKGTSADQDSRFANKQKKLLKQMKFPDNIDIKVDMSKVNLDVIKPWITKRLQELLGIEDDVVIEFVFNQLDDKNPDPKMMQINLTGFLGGSKARLFIGELWKFLASAQASPDGIPAELVDMKKRELLKRQEEDDRLREIRKREEDSHRQDIKPDIHKIDDRINGRHPMPSSNTKSRNENGNIAGYKSRAHYDDDRRRSPPKTHRSRNSRSPEPISRRTDKKVIQSTSKISASDDDHSHHHEKTKINPKSSSNRRQSPSKSPSHSRSPIKPPRKHQQRASSSSSVASNASNQATEKTKPRSSSSSPNVSPSHEKNHKSSHKKTNALSDDRDEIKRRKTNENNDQVKEQLVIKNKRKSPTPSPPRSKQSTKKLPIAKSTSNVEKTKSKVSPIEETKKSKKHSKRTRSSSSSHSSSSSFFSSSTSSSDSEPEKKKKQKKKSQPIKIDSSSRSRSPSPIRSRKSNQKKDDHKSRKHSTHNSKSSSKKRTKHHQSNDNKRKSHRDRPDKSITKKTSRNESSSRKTKDAEKKNRTSHQPTSDNEIPKSSTPPKKLRLESQIKVQTPPPSELSDNNKSQQELVHQSSAPIKPNRTERIVVLEESRSDSTGSVSKRVSITTKTVYNENHPMNDDENEIDLRERLLREKAIKSMRRRQLTNNDDDIQTKTTTIDRIVYDLK